MSDLSPILEFSSVSTSPDIVYDLPLSDVTFALRGGELALVRFDHHAPRTPLADAAMGLAALDAGEVRILGENWETLSPDQASRCRGQIGRLFEHRWVFHLDVDENVTLRLRHHTRRPLAEIDLEAEEL